MLVLLALRSGNIGLFEYLPCKEQVYASWSVFTSVFFSYLSYKSTQTSTQFIFILANQCSGHWSLNFALRAIRHNSKFFIAHTVLLVVLAGHSPFLKVSKSSSPTLKLNHSSGTWPAARFWGFLTDSCHCYCCCWVLWTIFRRDTLSTSVQGQRMAIQLLGLYRFCILTLSNFIGFVVNDYNCWAQGHLCSTVDAWIPVWQP